MVQSTMPPAASESTDAGAQPKALKYPKKSARTRAREFALQYDADVVYDKYWRPALDIILTP